MNDPKPIKLHAVRNDSRLTTFIYLLLRQDVSFGAIERIMEHLEKNLADAFQLCEPNIAAYARTIAEKLQL